jgi:hypothetical protein
MEGEASQKLPDPPNKKYSASVELKINKEKAQKFEN